VPGLGSAVGPHLRNQLIGTGATSVAGLLRLVGILPQPAPHALNGNGQAPSTQKDEPRAIKQLRASLQKTSRLCARMDLKALDLSVKSSLEAELRGIVRFYSELRSEF
jgi:hypothetical protein